MAEISLPKAYIEIELCGAKSELSLVYDAIHNILPQYRLAQSKMRIGWGEETFKND